MKRKSINVGKYGVNPFSVPMVIEVTEVVTDSESYFVDRDSCVRIYRTIPAREQMNMLTAMGAKCFNFMVHRLQPGIDYVKLTPADFCEYAGVKGVKTFYNAVADLQRCGILSPVAGVRSMYWVNSAIVCYGHKHEMYPDKVTVKYEFDKTSDKGKRTKKGAISPL